MQIPFNTLTGRSDLYKHTYLRTDCPKLAGKPQLFGNLHAYMSPIKTLETVLETVNQRSDIYCRNGINCVLVQSGKKKRTPTFTNPRENSMHHSAAYANISNNYSCKEMMDLFITGFGTGLLPVRFMRLNRKDLHYPLSSFGQTKENPPLYGIYKDTSSQPDINLY